MLMLKSVIVITPKIYCLPAFGLEDKTCVCNQIFIVATGHTLQSDLIVTDFSLSLFSTLYLITRRFKNDTR